MPRIGYRTVGWVLAALLSPCATGSGRAQLQIVIDPTSGILSNPTATAAFNRAADKWEARLADPITVSLVVNFAPLGAGTAGFANYSGPLIPYTGASGIRARLVADAVGEPSNAIVNSLPTSFPAVNVPGGVTPDGFIFLSQPHFRAIGGTTSGSDGTITFNSNSTFDFDRGNGVTATDFETVAIHEIGHILGFASAVDEIEGGGTNPSLTVMDLFRFNLTNSPATGNATQFQNLPREIRPGQEAVFDDTAVEFQFSTGVTGDGFQASHWKDRNSPGQTPIGVMDPEVEGNSFYDIFESDLRVLDLMGYEVVPVPEPGWVLAVGGLGVLGYFRRRRARAA